MWCGSTTALVQPEIDVPEVAEHLLPVHMHAQQLLPQPLLATHISNKCTCAWLVAFP
jgi:hypothetical protein